MARSYNRKIPPTLKGVALFQNRMKQQGYRVNSMTEATDFTIVEPDGKIKHFHGMKEAMDWYAKLWKTEEQTSFVAENEMLPVIEDVPLEPSVIDLTELTFLLTDIGNVTDTLRNISIRGNLLYTSKLNSALQHLHASEVDVTAAIQVNSKYGKED